MESQEISFNYFYRLFNEEMRKKYLEIYQKRINDSKNNEYSLSTDDIVSVYDKTLYDICINYIQLSNSTIDIFPKETFEFINLILDTMNDNPYRESFLTSLQFIYQNYFDILGKGCPILMLSEDSSMISKMEVILDSCNQITQIESVNMKIIEEDKIMTKLLEMEINHKQGPLPKVLYRIRKDI